VLCHPIVAVLCDKLAKSTSYHQLVSLSRHFGCLSNREYLSYMNPSLTPAATSASAAARNLPGSVPCCFDFSVLKFFLFFPEVFRLLLFEFSIDYFMCIISFFSPLIAFLVLLDFRFTQLCFVWFCKEKAS